MCKRGYPATEKDLKDFEVFLKNGWKNDKIMLTWVPNPKEK